MSTEKAGLVARTSALEASLAQMPTSTPWMVVRWKVAESLRSELFLALREQAEKGFDLWSAQLFDRRIIITS